MSEWPKKFNQEAKLGDAYISVIRYDLGRELYEQLRDGLGPDSSLEVADVLDRYEREVGNE